MVQRYGITLHLNCSRRHEMHKILALKGTRGPLVKVIVEWSVFFLPLSWFQQYLLECPHFKITAYDMQQRSSMGSIWGCCTHYRVCTLTAGPAGQPHRLFAWTYFKLWQSRVLAFFLLEAAVVVHISSQITIKLCHSCWQFLFSIPSCQLKLILYIQQSLFTLFISPLCLYKQTTAF